MGMLWPTLELMLGCAVVLVLWLGGREVIHGLSHVTLVSISETRILQSRPLSLSPVR